MVKLGIMVGSVGLTAAIRAVNNTARSAGAKKCAKSLTAWG
jgi:hypothetical protein